MTLLKAICIAFAGVFGIIIAIGVGAYAMYCFLEKSYWLKGIFFIVVAIVISANAILLFFDIKNEATNTLGQETTNSKIIASCTESKIHDKLF